MEAGQRTRRSGRNKSARWIVASIVVCSGMSCIAPVLYASTDCSRWVAEYKQGVMQRKAARRLRAAKFRLTAMMHKPAPPHLLPARKKMNPLQSLRRFQIDCGDLGEPDTPLNAAVLAPLPLVPPDPKFALVSFEEPMPELPPPSDALIAVAAPVPPLLDVPVLPVMTASLAPIVTPEPSTLLLVLSGAGAFGYIARRRRLENAKSPATLL